MAVRLIVVVVVFVFLAVVIDLLVCDYCVTGMAHYVILSETLWENSIEFSR